MKLQNQKRYHPTVWELQEFLLSPGASLESHLEKCDSCALELMQIRLDLNDMPGQEKPARVPAFTLSGRLLHFSELFQAIPAPAFRSGGRAATIHSAIVPLPEGYIVMELSSLNSNYRLDLDYTARKKSKAVISFFKNNSLQEKTRIEEEQSWELKGWQAGAYEVFIKENEAEDRKILEFTLCEP